MVGTRWGVNSTSTGRRATFDSACSISAVWRCVSSPYAETFSLASENRLVVFRPAARARHPRDRVGDDPRLDETQREQRRAREADRGRVAAGRGDVRVRRELVAVELDHAVREPADDLGRAVRLAVPARVHVGREPEVGAEVDHVRDVVEQAREEVLARAVRQHAEHEIETAEVGDVERREHDVAVRGRRATGRGRRAARPAFAAAVTCTTSISGWPGQQPQRLDPRIA